MQIENPDGLVSSLHVSLEREPEFQCASGVCGQGQDSDHGLVVWPQWGLGSEAPGLRNVRSLWPGLRLRVLAYFSLLLNPLGSQEQILLMLFDCVTYKQSEIRFYLDIKGVTTNATKC